MKIKKLIDATASGSHALTRVLVVIASVSAVIMTLNIVGNILARFFYKQPLLGTIEVVQMLLIVIVFGTVAYTEQYRRHIVIEIVVAHFPKTTQAILARIMNFIGAVVFVLMGWQAWELMWRHMFPKMYHTDILYIPLAPFMFMIAFGSILLALELLLHVYYPMEPEEGEKEEVW